MMPLAFLAARRKVMVIICRRLRGSGEPLPDFPEWPGVYRPVPDGINIRLALMECNRDRKHAEHKGQHYIPDVTKPPTERLATMVHKATLLMNDMKTAKLLTVFAHKRQQYYSLCSEARRYAGAQGLPVPDLPIPPINPFPGARPRGRWLDTEVV